jgi:predicted nucleotidyltransferase
MRLTKRQIEAIHNATREVFGSRARVKLFGSRVDDDARGGDIDLLIECPEPIENAGVFAARLAAKIQMRIGERKIDVLYVWPGMKQLPVHRAALEQGVDL